MGVNSLPKTVTRQRSSCDLNPGPTAPESSTLTTRLLTQVCWQLIMYPEHVHSLIHSLRAARINLSTNDPVFPSASVSCDQFHYQQVRDVKGHKI